MDDPWFTYFRGRGRRQIVPRNGKGWAAVFLLILIIALPALALPWLMSISLWLQAPLFLFILAVIVLFTRWAKGRSQIIDLDQIGKDYAEFQEWKKRHGKGRP